ncbi:hypothetical protein JOC54_001030 [Alkalihalobacillus xiaoxiensis]|uniref:Uncharacterized protein n=1 Tax=Shouchella xiaoxiensis TaxID=766895 RepID=A0ABS2SQL0_9BACI|nr:hypothetical protein [Shouchella xiaoxiensis]MBM7837799.1 hypothetical protein [Shouchella xiaoxiensis]
MKLWKIALIGSAVAVVVLIVWLKAPSTSTVADEIEKLQNEHGEIQRLTITQHAPIDSEAYDEYVVIEDLDVIWELLNEAAPTALRTTDLGPLIEYSLRIRTTDRTSYITLYDEGLSMLGTHFKIEGENLFVAAIEQRDFDWIEDAR